MQSSTAPSACHQTSLKQIQSSLISIPHLTTFTSSHSGSPIRRQPYRAAVSRTELFLSRFSAFSKGILYWFLVFFKVFSHLCTLNQWKWPYEACFSVYFPTFFFFVCKKQSFRIWFELLRYRCGPNHGCEMSFVFFLLDLCSQEDEQCRIPGLCSEFRVWDSFVWVFWSSRWARDLTQWRRGSEGQRDP